jgi:hypothetical protein
MRLPAQIEMRLPLLEPDEVAALAEGGSNAANMLAPVDKVT